MVPDFLGPREMIIELAQNLSKCLVCPYKLFPADYHARQNEKNQAKTFSHRECSLFLKNLVLDILGPREMIIELAQYLSKRLVCHYNLFPEVCDTRYYEKIMSKVFFTGKIAFFSEICVFIKLLGVTVLIL